MLRGRRVAATARVVSRALGKQPARADSLEFLAVVSIRSQPGRFGGLSTRCVEMIVRTVQITHARTALPR
jgi:hypothetical protein